MSVQLRTDLVSIANQYHDAEHPLRCLFFTAIRLRGYTDPERSDGLHVVTQHPLCSWEKANLFWLRVDTDFPDSFCEGGEEKNSTENVRESKCVTVRGERLARR